MMLDQDLIQFIADSVMISDCEKPLTSTIVLSIFDTARRSDTTSLISFSVSSGGCCIIDMGNMSRMPRIFSPMELVFLSTTFSLSHLLSTTRDLTVSVDQYQHPERSYLYIEQMVSPSYDYRVHADIV